MNGGIARQQAIYKIRCNAALVVVLENKRSVWPAFGHLRIEFKPDVAQPFLHLLDFRKCRRDQTKPHWFCINRKRQIVEHTLHISPLLDFRQNPIPIRIDARNYHPKHLNARGQPHLHNHTVRRHINRRSL